MQLFNDCRSGWSKESQWENDRGSFLTCFLLVLCVPAKLFEGSRNNHVKFWNSTQIGINS
jgi:hypothetical protein